MFSARTYLSFVAASAAFASIAVVACSSDTTDNPVADAGADSTTPTSGDSGPLGVPVTANGVTILTLAEDLPFTAASVVSAGTGAVLDAQWGNHGGPMVTTSDATTNALSVTRYTVSGTTATPSAITPAVPTNLPSPASSYFWTADGLTDLPFGDVAVTSYSQSNAQSQGEVFLYSQNYDTVVARAYVNGFYGGRGVTDGTKTRLVYAGLSDLSDAATTDDDNGLWATDITATALEGTVSLKLFSWAGFSGPVATDNDGDVFVAASVTGGAHADEIYAVTQAQALGTTAVTQATIADADTQGTDSLAVASVKGSGKGWVFAKGYDAASTPANVYARAFTVSGGTIASSGDEIAAAITPSAGNSVTVFGSPDGDLWVAVKGASASYFVQLTPK